MHSTIKAGCIQTTKGPLIIICRKVRINSETNCNIKTVIKNIEKLHLINFLSDKSFLNRGIWMLPCEYHIEFVNYEQH